MLPPPLPSRPQVGRRSSKTSSSPLNQEEKDYQEVIGVEFDAADENTKLAISREAPSLLGFVDDAPSSSIEYGGAPSPGLVRLMDDAEKLEGKLEGEVAVESSTSKEVTEAPFVGGVVAEEKEGLEGKVKEK